MNVISGGSSAGFSSIRSLSIGSSGAAMLPVSATPALGKGQKAAREFEAQLIASLLESLEKTFAAVPGKESIAGADNYNYLGTQALSSALAAGGGFGIA